MSAATPPFPDLFDKAFVIRCRQSYEAIRQRRKGRRGRPSEEQRAQLDADKDCEPFLRWVGSQTCS
jgi:hypothetical protein